jgi:integrase
MRKFHPRNERVKRDYLAYLEEAKRMSTKTTDHVAAALSHFETTTGHRDFRHFHVEQARRFKRLLAEAAHVKTGRPLSKATIHARLLALRAFFAWLAGQPGYRSRIAYSDAQYFNPSAGDSRVATAHREKPGPTIEQVRQAIASMPTVTTIDLRNRAVVAFALLSGARDDAIASFSLRHVDVSERIVFHDARTVRTKNRKTFKSWFFPVGDDFEQLVVDWIALLEGELKAGKGDPLFPATQVRVGQDGLFETDGLSREYWRTANPIREIFRDAFEGAGLPYFNPHSLRKTLALLGERVCSTPEAFKAWSQNLGHEHVSTTFTSYGSVAPVRQGEIICALRNAPNDSGPDTATVQKVLRHLMKNGS